MLNKVLIFICCFTAFVACDQKHVEPEMLILGDERLSVSMTKPQKEMRSSDLLNLTFEIEHHHQAQITIISTTEDFGSFDFVEQEINSLGVVSPERVKSQIVLTLEPSLPASHGLPSLIIQSLEKSGEKYVLSIPPMNFEVLSVLSNQGTELQDIEKKLDGEAISVPLVISLSLGVLVALFVIVSYLATADTKHKTEVSLDPDILTDLRRGVKGFADLELLICRFIRADYKIDLAPLDAMRTQVELDQKLNGLISSMEEDRFAIESAGHEAHVKIFEEILISRQAGGDL